MSWLTSLSQRDARLVALAVLVLLVWLGYALVAEPLLAAHSTLSAEIEASRKQLGRLETILGRAGSENETRQGNQPQTTWQGTSPPVIAANVQKQIQALAQSRGLTIVSISQTRSRFDEEFQTAGLVIEGHGEIAAFVDLFTTLERNRPLLFVDKLMVRRYQPP
ncbi:MAG: type II secretion system protein GspM, partial [Pseudomonadota bacterium]